MAKIKVKLSKRIRDIRKSPKNFVDNAMLLINEEIGKFLVGRSNQNKIPPGKDPNNLSGKRLGKAPLAKTFQNFRRSNQGGFAPYSTKYRRRKELAKKKNWLTVTGELFTDMVTAARIIPSKKGVKIIPHDGLSAKYLAVHFFGSGRVPKRNAYGAFNTADRKAVNLIVQNRLIVAFGPRGGIVKGGKRSRKRAKR